MEVEHTTADTIGNFKLIDQQVVAALISYSKAGKDVLIIDHTEVNPEYKGKGLGKNILLEVVQYARENNKKIIPLCPFAAAVFKKNDNIQDVLK